MVARSGKRVGETAMGAQKDEKWPEGRSETALDGRAAQEQRRRKEEEGRRGAERLVSSKGRLPRSRNFGTTTAPFKGQGSSHLMGTIHVLVGSEEGAKIALIFQQPCPAFNNESI